MALAVQASVCRARSSRFLHLLLPALPGFLISSGVAGWSSSSAGTAAWAGSVGSVVARGGRGIAPLGIHPRRLGICPAVAGGGGGAGGRAAGPAAGKKKSFRAAET